MNNQVYSVDQITKMLNTAIFQSSVGPWVLSSIITARLGISEMAMREYRRCAVWAEGVHWAKNPKGRIIYNVKAIDLWMASNV
ncbi:excisionase family protein [Colwellia sp. MEBiC06753]